MRQFRWGRKAEFPYTKVFVLGILLTVLGSACVVVSVIGIVQLAWGYYVSTGMWGGVTVTVSGLAAMYAARAQSPLSARLYFFLSLVTCLVSFAMIVLSAGGLTYKSNFYQPMRFESHRHQVTLFLHGSVLGVGVLSLACNVLSVIVCCKFITHEKDRAEESIKLRRRRHRLSDPAAAHRTSCLRGGSGTVRTSTSSRIPLFGSDRSRKHSRQASESDSTNLKISGERTSHRRDSDRSKGSSRSRHSHLRQSSSVSQQSRHSTMEAEVTTVLLRETEPNYLSSHIERASSHSTTDNARDAQADILTDTMSVQLVFDPDEEPLPPYEEARPSTILSSDGNESDTETVDGSSNVVVPSCLPLNIPVTRIGACQVQALQGQPPPMSPSHTQHSQQRRGHHVDDITSAMERTSLEPNSSGAFSSHDRGNHVSMMRTTTDQRTKSVVSPDHQPVPQARNSSGTHPTEDGSASPEICALTGERMTPVAALQPDTVTGNSSVFTSCVAQQILSPDSSDTSFAGDAVSASQNSAFSHSNSGAAPPASSNSTSALPSGIHSPSSAFRPVGKRVVPLAQASPSHSVPLHNLFSPIASPGSAHHTVYSPIASPSAANRFVSPASPHHANHSASSSESLSRGGAGQSLSWKKIPLPSSHNHSNRTSSVPFKEVTSKTIPGPSQPLHRDKDAQPHSLPRQSSRRVERRAAVPNAKKLDGRTRTQFVPVSADTNASCDPVLHEQSGPRLNDNSSLIEKGVCSAFVKRHPGTLANVSTTGTMDSHFIGIGSQLSGSSSHGANMDKRQTGALADVSMIGTMDSHFIAISSQLSCSGSHGGNMDGQHAVEINRPSALSGHSTKVSGNPVAVNSQPTDVSSHSTNVANHRSTVGSQPAPIGSHFKPIGSQPVAAGNQPTAIGSNFKPIGSQPVAVGSQPTPIGSNFKPIGSQPVAVGSQPTAIGSNFKPIGSQPVAVGSQPTAIGSNFKPIGSQPVAVGSQPTAIGSNFKPIGSQPVAVGSQPTAIGSNFKPIGSQPVAVGSQPTAIGSNFKPIGSQPVAVGSQPTAIGSHFKPIGSQPVAVGSHAVASNSKQPSAFGSPSRTARGQVVGLDPSRRSAGCQATDDGGIASSMDRTHRWVMGTLPSGTRFQGTTKNTALIHSTTRNSTLSQGTPRNTGHVQAAPRNNVLTQGSPRHAVIDRNTTLSQSTTRNLTLAQGTTRNPTVAVHSSPGHKVPPLAPVARHSSGRVHGAWSRPSKAAAPAATVTQSVSSATSSQPAIQQPSMPAEAQRGAPSSRLPRYHTAPQAEPQPRLQPPLQPAQQSQSHRQHRQPQQEQLWAQLEGEQNQDQQQGKPLFSVLL